MSLVKQASNQVLMSKSPSGAAGKALVLGGTVGGGLWLAAGLIPFVSFPMLILAMIVFGFFMWE